MVCAIFCLWRPDPTIIIEAEGEQDTKKALKSISFPLMDDDALASSYVQKVLGALSKWRVKMHSLCTIMEDLDQPPDSLKRSFSFIEFSDKLFAVMAYHFFTS